MTPPSLTLVTYQELATAWGVSRRTVHRWFAADAAHGHRIRRAIRPVNAARRYVVVRADDAAAVLRRHRVKPKVV